MSCKYHCEDGPFVEGTPPVDNYCSSCGRDLRLPVARLNGPLSDAIPEKYDGLRWWRFRRIDNSSWKEPEEHPFDYIRGYLSLDLPPVFGPVTVSPREVPDGE